MSTTTSIVYESPEGRVRVERVGREFDLFLDGNYCGTYRSQSAAEHEGAVWLCEQARQLAADLADEQAERDAAAATTLVINRPGLQYALIPVTAQSYALRTEAEVNGQIYVGVEVDGRFYPLVLWKHTVGRPEWIDAVQGVASDVFHAAGTLQQAARAAHVTENERRLAAEVIPAVPEDAQAESCPDCDRQFWRSEMSGRCYDMLNGRQIFTCPCGRDITPHLSNGGPSWPDEGDDEPACVHCGAPATTTVDRVLPDGAGEIEVDVCWYCYGERYAEDVPTPEQQAQRDAENEADMLDFLRTSTPPDDDSDDSDDSDDTAPPAVAVPDDDPEPTPPTPAAARVLWQWGGSARVLRAVIAERQRLVAA